MWAFSFALIVSVLFVRLFFWIFFRSTLYASRVRSVCLCRTAIDVGELPFPRRTTWVVAAKSTMAQAEALLPPRSGYTLLRMHVSLAMARVRLAFECEQNLRELPADGALEKAAGGFCFVCSMFCAFYFVE